MRHRVSLFIVLIQLVLLTCVSSTQAWFAEGHILVVRATMTTLPDELPAFFREGGNVIAHLSVDPDAFKHRRLPQLTDREEPDHFFDLELVQAEPLPDKRHAFIELCQRLNQKPAKVGYLPYAIAEHTQQLTLAFAEYRRFSQDPVVQMKVLVYAGLLAHYAADLSQPLHCTIHWDGRADPVTGKSPRSGIHARIDALIEQVQPTTEELTQGIQPAVMTNLFTEVLTQIDESRKHIDKTYELEASLPGKEPRPAVIDPQVRAYTVQRTRHAVQVTANLYLTAWRNSETIELPDWLIRARQLTVR